MNSVTFSQLNTSGKDTETLTSELQSKLFKEWGDLGGKDYRELRKKLKAVVEWQELPEFKRTGRSAFLKLEKPIEIPSSNSSTLKIKAIKIKGVGARTHTGQTLKPTNESVCNNNPHLGFDSEGNFRHLKTSPAPIGGIVLNRAAQEFNVAKHLFRFKCPCIVPLQVHKYTSPGMLFLSGETPVSAPLGVVITGLPDSSYLRVDSIFNYHCLDFNEKAELNDWMDRLGIVSPKNSALSLIAALGRLYGKTIRKFSESGLYRYSGAPDNYSYCTDTGEVFLIDLDSSLELKKISLQQQSLEIMRDAASGIAYLLAFFTDPRSIQYFPIEDVIDANPFRELLLGYYSNLDPTYVDNKSRIIVEYYQEVYKNSLFYQYPVDIINSDLKQGEEAVQEFRRYLSKSYMRPWISRSRTFAHLMPVCWLLHQESEIRPDLPVLDKERLFENIGNYVGEPYGSAIVKKIKRSLEL
jgi:hypothetical protein